MKFKFLEHTADIKFQSSGKTLEEAFENAALALQEVITKKTKIKPKIKKTIKVSGKDYESLLYNFLEEFLFLLDAEDFILLRIISMKITRISITNRTKKIYENKAEADEDNKEKYNYKLKAEITGDKASNYKFSNDVKAITYNEMFVKKEKGRWVCQVVVDV